MTGKEIKDILLKKQDLKYKDFHSKLIPNVDKSRVIGAKIPILRDIARKVANDTEYFDTKSLYYREEILIYGFAIGYKKIPINEKLKLFDEYLEYANSWETVDTVIFGVKDFNKKDNKEIVYNYFTNKLKSSKEFVLRAGIVGLLRYCLDDEHIKNVAKSIVDVKQGEYYVDMAIAWCIAEILALDYDLGMKIILNDKLTDFVKNKAIQKAIESFKISKEQKEELRKLR